MKKLCLYLCMLVLAACSSGNKKAPAPDITITCASPQTGCMLYSEETKLDIRFNSTPSSLRPFDLIVGYDNKADSITASFQMPGMDMGFNRYQMIRDSGKWRANIVLPFCVRNRHDWILILEVKTARETRRYKMPFVSS